MVNCAVRVKLYMLEANNNFVGLSSVAIKYVDLRFDYNKMHKINNKH